MECILLQETQTDNLCDFKHQLLVVRQYVSSNQLHNFHQAALLYQKRHQTVSVVHKPLIHIVHVPGGQVVYIFRIAGKPMDGREVPGVSQGFIQSPEAAHESLGIHGHRLGEIASLRRHCADDGHGAFGSIEVLHHACPLVEGGKAGCQVSRETFLGRHFLQTARQLP